MGAAGINMDDLFFPTRCGRRSEKAVVPAEQMIGKVRACDDIRNRRDVDFVISVCTYGCAVDGFGEAVRRCNLYLDAGADLVSINAIGGRDDIERAVGAVQGPLSIDLMDGVTGVDSGLIPIPELAAMGIAQVSIPMASIMVAHRALTDFFDALKTSPTGLLLGEANWLTDLDRFETFTGVDTYTEMEDKYFLVDSS
jgi:2-methylisocitrate lyase-like PEP mutase family enzyme